MADDSEGAMPVVIHKFSNKMGVASAGGPTADASLGQIHAVGEIHSIAEVKHVDVPPDIHTLVGINLKRTEPSPAITIDRVAREDAVQAFDPALLRELDKFGPKTPGLARSLIHMPVMISPTDSPADNTLLQDPDDASKRYALSSFQLATTRYAGSPADVPWVVLGPASDGNGYTLEAHINCAVAFGVAALPVPPRQIDTRITLRATLTSGAAFMRDFDQASVTDNAWTVKMTLGGPSAASDLAKVFDAMAKSRNAQLMFRRSMDLAFAVTTPLPNPKPHPIFFPKPFPRPIIDDPPFFPKPFPRTIDDPPPEQLFAVRTTAIDSLVPFSFDQGLFPQIYQVAAAASTTVLGYIPHHVDWQPDPGVPAVQCTYFQDNTDRRALYFLPDQFAIQRRTEPPHRPFLSLGTLDDGNKISLGYVALPMYSRARIDAATTALRGKEGVPQDMPAMKLFPAGNAVLRLKLPGGDAATGGPGYVDQGNSVNVQTNVAVNGNVTLSKDDFKSVFDALVSDDSDLLSGFVDVTVEKDKYHVPFVARAAQFFGPTLDVSASPDAGSGGIKVVAQNGIESPILVNSLPASLTRADQIVSCHVVSTTPAVPTTLAPAADDGTPAGTVTLVVAPDDGLGGDLKAQTSLSACFVQPDGAALLEEIIDTTVQSHSTRDISVQLLASVFTPPPPAGTTAPPPPIVVRVEFLPSGVTADFQTGQQPTGGSPFLVQKATLQYGLRDFLLGKLQGTEANYTYCVHVLSTAGEVIGAPDSTQNGPTLYILKLPS